MSEATQTQTQTLEETLNKTDLGHLIYEHRKTISSIIVAILVAVLAWIAWKETKVSSAMNAASEVYTFESQVWSEAKTGKTTPADLVASFKKLPTDVQLAPMMVPVVLEMGKFLYEKGSLDEAVSLLALLEGKLTNTFSAFLVGTQMAVILEKQEKYTEAAKVLENLLKNKDMFMQGKVALDLGRIYVAMGEKGKAQTQFDYVISNFPSDDYAKLAKLYLAKLAQ